MVVHLLSPEQRYDPLYISNYAYLQVRDELLRLPGIQRCGGVGRRRVQHAPVARPRPDRRARADGGRGDRRGTRTERPGGDRRRRPGAGLHRGLPGHGEYPRAAERRRAVRRHHRPHRRRRPGDAPARRRADRDGRRCLCAAQPAGRRAGGGLADHPEPRSQRAGYRRGGACHRGEARRQLPGRSERAHRLRPDGVRPRFVADRGHHPTGGDPAGRGGGGAVPA